ncbi:conserved hypothetical protein [Paraburkholderia unamae]|uniref:hypothetical protein n=1 Tax=Paraburkholderia unamae TaxID=219649 RepID=UPI001CB26E74|nr:hypothetical protein [Paraburkholderia unamae]CAG9265683.1 conserved hypothetical protein [Paraburkholderia unamae]
MRYKGYNVEPSAHALPSGLYAANLTIENGSPALESSFSFEALDYFFEPDHAIAYASRWARLWIDQRGQAAARRRGG